MSLEAAFIEIMNDSVTLAAVSAKDAYGKRTWAAPTTVTHCRVQSGDHKVLDQQGQEQLAIGRVYIPNKPAIGLNYKLTLPDGSQPPILAINYLADDSADHHTVVHYGSTRG